MVLTSGIDPTARKGPERLYSGQCTRKFKSAECDYTGDGVYRLQQNIRRLHGDADAPLQRIHSSDRQTLRR